MKDVFMAFYSVCVSLCIHSLWEDELTVSWRQPHSWDTMLESYWCYHITPAQVMSIVPQWFHIIQSFTHFPLQRNQWFLRLAENYLTQPLSLFFSFLFLNNQTEQPLMLFSLAVSGSVPVLLIHFPSSALRNRGAYRSARAGKSERQSWACDGRRTWWWCSCLWHVIRAVTPVCRSPEPCTTRLIDSF